jgi:transcriptional regulator with XRE-family HTH domain
LAGVSLIVLMHASLMRRAQSAPAAVGQEASGRPGTGGPRTRARSVGPVSSNVDMATELASFLRSRRERLPAPQRALPSGRRACRTPGLRREDVAELVGVSVDYIVRLEQGRGLRPSSEVLEGLARALQLRAAWAAHPDDPDIPALAKVSRISSTHASARSPSNTSSLPR